MAQQHSNCNRNKLFVPCKIRLFLINKINLLYLDDKNRVILHSPSESMYINASKVTVR